MRGFVIVIIFTFLQSKVYSQVDINICSKQKIRIQYSNQTDSLISYFNPYIFLSYDIKRKRSYIREDRHYISGDTLYIFFNDTTINEIGFNINPIDETIKKNEGWIVKTLPPNGKVTIMAYLRRKYNFKFVVVHASVEDQCITMVKRKS